MSKIIHQHFANVGSLHVLEPLDGRAIMTCKIRTREDVWEPRMYEFRRTPSGTWIIDMNPGLLQRDCWDAVIGWCCYMQPIEIDLVTTLPGI